MEEFVWYMTYSYLSFSSCQFENLIAYVLRNARDLSKSYPVCLERRYTPSSEQDAKSSAKHPKTLFAEKKNTYPLHTGDAV